MSQFASELNDQLLAAERDHLDPDCGTPAPADASEEPAAVACDRCGEALPADAPQVHHAGRLYCGPCWRKHLASQLADAIDAYVAFRAQRGDHWLYSEAQPLLDAILVPMRALDLPAVHCGNWAFCYYKAFEVDGKTISPAGVWASRCLHLSQVA